MLGFNKSNVLRINTIIKNYISLRQIKCTMGKWIKENWSLLLLIGVCVVVYTIILLLSNFLSNKPNEFGDSAGVASGLFSAVAFAGVVYAIFLQKKELELQREGLKQTREELEGQKHEFEQQNETLKCQRFESTFFNMLSLQQEIVNGLTYEYEANETVGENDRGRKIFKQITRYVRGRDLFFFLYEKESLHIDLKNSHYLYSKSLMCLLTEKKAEIMLPGKGHIPIEDYTEKQFSFRSLYDISDYPSYFDHYFRHLYRIIKFVDESPLLLNSFEDRYQYTSMVRAQLSRYELIWLFYNCLSSNGVDKFKSLIEKYALLKNMRFELLAKEEHRSLYAKSAYEKTLP